MIFRRIYDETVAQAAYLIGCQRSGEALVVDPSRDLAPYLAAAAAEHLRITHVAETHIHADFLSGSRELAHREGARLLLSFEGGPGWSYRFAPEAGATLVGDGSAFSIGEVRIDVRHTPGHTPEHLTFLVTDTAASSDPVGALTGDFIFVGDVGRPDLLERAAKLPDTTTKAARALYRSLRAFEALPDYLQLWPGHGAGSACGKAIGAMPQSTLGYERRVSWAFAPMTEDEFVRRVLAGQPDPPPYFALMKRLNRDDPPPQRLALTLGPVGADRALEAARLGALTIDLRPARVYAAGHLPGTINIPYSRAFVSYAGWLVSYDRDLYLVGIEESTATAAARDLSIIGIDRVAGYVPASALDEWDTDSRKLQTTASVEPSEADALRRTGRAILLDVRARSEWNDGHVPDAMHVPLGELQSRLGDLPRDRLIVVHCQAGDRSAIASSVLAARGVSSVANLRGGIGEWQRAGLPIERPDGRAVP